MLPPRLVKYYKLSFAIGLFLILMGVLHWFKPGCTFDHQGQYREFGLGHQRTTVFPIWLVTIVLAIFSYLAVAWYTVY